MVAGAAGAATAEGADATGGVSVGAAGAAVAFGATGSCANPDGDPSKIDPNSAPEIPTALANRLMAQHDRGPHIKKP